MTNAKHAKLMNSNHLSSKFGEGVILEPIKTANDQYTGGTGCQCGSVCQTCYPLGATKCGTAGCGSSNKIKVYQ
ncbi:hypothetical protein [Lysinibacillus fusiformis]|uniref:hypothetical protein n=1 Tax=Lysinibacillus fusiformis TaxID=28031 RepID=UPI00263A8942|nr:hypothetical protein [Lysinibacillus fusiformis]MDC6268622.1 hypothetical protein [Lysinibacillus sphaericus]MDN4969415.1 hypothetical protein [Lysinibacillus fusiformis]